MNRHMAQGGLVASMIVASLLTGGLLLARQATGRVAPASEEAARYGIRAYQYDASANSSERRVSADLLGGSSEVLGRIEMVTTPGTERATIRWKGDTITLIAGKDQRYEFVHEGRNVASGKDTLSPEGEEFFRVHAERIDILRVVGGELWSLAAERARGKKTGSGRADKDDGVALLSGCSGEWTWDCNWGVRVFRSWACGDARTRTGEECSTRMCLGCCAFGDCNCACMVGDFNCVCCVDGRRCL